MQTKTKIRIGAVFKYVKYQYYKRGRFKPIK